MSGSQIILALAGAGLAAGAGAAAAGVPQAASVCWVAGTTAVLIPAAWSVAGALRNRRMSVDVIALLAMAGALVLQEFLTGAVIALMLAGGQALERIASARAKRELAALLERSPRIAHRCEGASLNTIAASEVSPGDVLLVKPGELVPVDGVVASGTVVLDESALTGESRPVRRLTGERIRSGAINSAASPFRMCATVSAAESTYSGIVRMVAQAQNAKAPLIRMADRYASVFLPVTAIVAAGAWIWSGDPLRALAVLVVATPCPLILAAPVAIVSGLSRAARRGIVVKGGGPLEIVARAKTLVIDKTGTVTAGFPVLASIESFGGYEPSEILRLAASLDQVSPHVLAQPILKEAAARQLALSFPVDAAEDFGSGIRGLVDGRRVAIGKRDWVLPDAETCPQVRRVSRRIVLDGSSGVFIAIDGRMEGALILEDPLRVDAPTTVRALRQSGFERISMLTGDHADVARAAGSVLGVDEVLPELSPAGKVEAVRRESSRAVTVMVGDGINDAPALAAADVGVAMGARGATASSEAADIVLVADRLDRLVELVEIARRSRNIALESVVAGMGLSLIAMAFAAAGLLTPVAGAVIQEVIDVLVILNALRAVRDTRTVATAEEAGVARRFGGEHRRMLPEVKRLRHVADRLEAVTKDAARHELGSVRRFLAEEVLPHELDEDTRMYPAVTRMIGGNDPTATMSRAHREITHLIAAFGRQLDDMAPDGPTVDDLCEIRRLLYGLEAVLRLHFAQEDEAYVVLLDREPSVDSAGSPGSGVQGAERAS